MNMYKVDQIVALKEDFKEEGIKLFKGDKLRIISRHEKRALDTFNYKGME